MAPNTTGSSQAGPSATANTAVPENTPTSLDDLVQFLTTTQDTAQVKKTLQNFGSKETRDTLLASSLGSGQDPLDVLDPAANTLGCLYILSARLSVQGAPPPQLSALETFCKVFNPEQARQAPERVTLLAKGIAKATADNLKYALTPLRDLVLRYPPTLSHLTTIHPIYLNACVTTRHYTAALPLLTTPILHIDTTLSDLHYNDNLLYHYAGGVAFGALKRWREAEEFFEIVATAPAQVPAAIQFEALKKLTLVQLILYGKALPTPKYTHQSLTRLLKNSPYQTLARAYPQTIPALQNTLKQDVETLRTDKNLGLVQQVIERVPRWLIRKLTSTYLTLGLADIGREVGIESEDEVRSVIASMVENDEINASISVDGTVTFFDPTPQFSKADVDAALSQAQAQSKLLFELERALNTSREFLSKAIKHKDESWGPSGPVDDDAALYGHGGGHHMGGGWADESMFA